MAAVGNFGAGSTPASRTAQLLRWQADACRELGSPLYGDLLAHAADDLLLAARLRTYLRGHLD